MDNEKFQGLVLQQLKSLNDGQQEIKKELSRVENKVDKLELRMESEVIDKIRVLFDADKVREEKLNQVVEKLDGIEIDTGYLVSRVSRLEKMVK